MLYVAFGGGATLRMMGRAYRQPVLSVIGPGSELDVVQHSHHSRFFLTLRRPAWAGLLAGVDADRIAQRWLRPGFHQPRGSELDSRRLHQLLADLSGRLATDPAPPVSGLLAPLAGTYADAKHARLSLLAVFTLLCGAATALLSLPRRGDIALAAVLFIAAQVGYTVAMSLYDAYVERLAPLAGGAERLSSLGWALGFLGGIAAILLVMPLAHGEPAPDDTPRYALAFPLIALLFGALAVPALLGLRPIPPPAALPAAALQPWRRVGTTLCHWRAHRTVMRFLLGSYLINDAVVTDGPPFAPSRSVKVGRAHPTGL